MTLKLDPAGLLQGYGLAQVTVPAQKISDGIVELQIIEGRIGAIAVTGNEDYSFEFLKRRLELLTPGRVYTDVGMERGVLLLVATVGVVTLSKRQAE